MTFDQLYNAMKTYAEDNDMTPAQLAKATQRQVVNALELTGEDRSMLLSSWDSLRRRVYDAWKEETRKSELEALKAQAAVWLAQYFPNAEWERQGDIVTIYLRGRE